MVSIHEVLRELGFTQKPYTVEGRTSIVDLFNSKQRCGIYVLHFSNGEYYVGQAVDVTRRYAQHRKTHNDITRINFKKVEQSSLCDEEKTVIHALEAATFPLRNVALTSIPYGLSDFDLIIPLEEQQRWLLSTNYNNFSGPRVVNSELRAKYSLKYQKFQLMPYHNSVLRVLQEYIKIGIPVPLHSELSFWGCSCLPNFSSSGSVIYSRVSINWQEVFTVYDDCDLYFSIHLAKSPLKKLLATFQLRAFILDRTLQITDHTYTPGGQDQVNIVVRGSDRMLELLKNEAIISAIRLFNLRLMKKGPCTYSRNHCLDLADQILPSS